MKAGSSTLETHKALMEVQASVSALANAESDAVAYHAIYKAALDEVHAAHKEKMQAQLTRCTAMRAQVLNDLAHAEAAFQSKKSFKFDGINYGFKIHAAKIEVHDLQGLIQALKSHSKSLAKTLIVVKEELPAASIKLIPDAVLHNSESVRFIDAKNCAFVTSANESILRVPS